MDANQLRALQAPLKKRYREQPETARIPARAEAMLLRDQPVMPIMFYSSKNLVSKRVSGWKANLLDRHLTRYLSMVR